MRDAVVQHLRVRGGSFCVLVQVEVRGNVTAEPGAGLAFDFGTIVEGNVDLKERSFTNVWRTTVGGNFTCDRCLVDSVVDLKVGGNLRIVSWGTDDGFFVVGSTIEGSLEIVESAGAVHGFLVTGSTIAGNVKLEKNAGRVAVVDNTIGGNLQVAFNDAGDAPCPSCTPPRHRLLRNIVRGNMQVFENTGPLEVGRNTVDQSLQCSGNSPAPVVLENIARDADGQCAAQ